MLSRTLCERYLVPEEETISTTTISLCCKSMHFVAWCRGRRKCTRFRTSSVRPFISGLATGITPRTLRASMFRLIPRCLALFRHVPEQVFIPTRPSICNQIEQFNDGTASTKPGHSTLFPYVPECSSKSKSSGSTPAGSLLVKCRVPA